jgi:hypothetical protein
MTDIQKIKKFFLKNQRLPSYSEMLTLFDIKSKNTVAYRVEKLIKEGKLVRNGRHLMITNQ